MAGFSTTRTLLASLVLGLAAVAGGVEDDPPYDPTSPEDVAERNEEEGGEPDLSGPTVEPQQGRRGGGVPGSPGAQPDLPTPGMRGGGGGEATVVNVLATHCERCHGAEKQKGGLQILPLDQMFTGSEDYWVVRRGEPSESELYRRITLASSHEDIMPPDGDPMSKAEIELVASWIRSGAPTDVQPASRQRTVRPRQWFQLYMQLDLDAMQRSTAMESVSAFDTGNQSFEQEYRQRINELRKITQSAESGTYSQEEIDQAKAELERINAMKEQVTVVQAELWALLTSEQQEAFRAMLTDAATATRGDRAGRPNRRGARGNRGDRQPSTLTQEEQRRLRELMRERRRNQGDGDGGSGRD